MSRRLAVMTLSATLAAMLAGETASAQAKPVSPCGARVIGEGHVARVIDGRTFVLGDGREIRLGGLAPLTALATPQAREALHALIANRDVVLQGDDETPDRYGRQSAYVTTAQTPLPVQLPLLQNGAAIASGIGPEACVRELLAAERVARQAGRDIWTAPDAIKNAHIPADVLAKLGQFAIVEGNVVSARQAGATIYVNFGRRWSRDFAVTMSKNLLPALERAGLSPASLVNRRLRVRGVIEQQGGPRINVRAAAQIEIVQGGIAAREIATPDEPANDVSQTDLAKQ